MKDFKPGTKERKNSSASAITGEVRALVIQDLKNSLKKNLSGMKQAKLILPSGREVDYVIPQSVFLPYFSSCL